MPIVSGGSGGGASFPSQWTVDQTHGGLAIGPTSDASTELTLKPAVGQGNAVLDVLDSGNNEVNAIFNDGSQELQPQSDITAFILRPAVAATGRIMQVGRAADALGYFDAQGRLVIGNTSAPADGTLAAGEAALWFDKTDGAAKLMIKAKQANGTVKTGSVNVQT